MLAVRRFWLLGLICLWSCRPATPATAPSVGPVPSFSGWRDGTINVSGTATVNVVPDEILLSLGAQYHGDDVEAGKEDVRSRVETILQVLKEQGVEDRDIHMTGIRISRDFRPSVPEAYCHVSRDFEIRFRDVAEFEATLEKVLENGVNVVSKIEYRTTELRKYRDQARQMAARAAKEKAEAVCSELGVTCGKATSINLEDSRYWYGNSASPNVSQNVIQSTNPPAGAGDAQNGESFSAGMISVSASVSVSFSITQPE